MPIAQDHLAINFDPVFGMADPGVFDFHDWSFSQFSYPQYLGWFCLEEEY